MADGVPKKVRVPHLGGIDVSYRMSRSYSPNKPTLVLVNSFTTSAELYRAQFADKKLTLAMNLLAIELLGHGDTRTKSETFTYWDTAIMNLQVLEALGIKKAFVLGTSQGGWITVRMALLGPEVISGIIPLGTSMDYESERTRKLGCWDGNAEVSPLVEHATSAQAVSSWEPTDMYCNFLIDIGFGKDIDSETRDLWTQLIKKNYQGDDGRKRARQAAINLRERDGLHGRLFDVRCPVLWLHGDQDVVYSVKNAEEEIKMFVNSPDARLMVVVNGHHFLSWTNPEDVNARLVEFVTKFAKGVRPDARAMREAVGMVEM
ncbi:alpha/beta hydrolase fold family protein [Trichodelitschia bisporula]|uniref:Alpha/beta hydrolase fold family protein n=1 Tax=Trichodelitschia bisporula TaxID=703511 RepID=A0A6G1HLJ9_9PEZI|nr:alpha/beta hydrolase fold family protein [Trichodelitschia bisporula]